jgi:hypothetical protein
VAGGVLDEETTTMETIGMDEFGLTRVQRVAMADAELAEARALASQWKYPDGFPERGMQGNYLGLLGSAATLYHVEGLRLLSRRINKLAREVDVRRAWDWFDNINRKAI